MKYLWTILSIGALAGVCIVVYFIFDPGRMERYWKDLQAGAKVQLTYVCHLEEDHFELYETYSKDPEAIGFYQEPTGKPKWWVEIVAADSQDFIARAYAQIDFDKDSVQNIWEIRKDCIPREIRAD